MPVDDDESSYRLRLGSVITELRLARKMPRQEDLAKELGVHVSTIQRWETGKTMPNARDVRDLSDVLKVDCSVLVNPPDRLSEDLLDVSYAVGLTLHREMVKRAARRSAARDDRERG